MRIGFVALTDPAPVINSRALGFYEVRGLGVDLITQAS